MKTDNRNAIIDLIKILVMYFPSDIHEDLSAWVTNLCSFLNNRGDAHEIIFLL